MARRAAAIVGTLCFFVIAPGVVAGLVPYRISGWRRDGDFLSPAGLLAIIPIVVGLAILLDSFARFALQRLGTPAPPFPTRRLVVVGQYRWVRNPMYLCVAAIIFGQAALFRSPALLLYGVVVAVCFHLFVIAYEEPTLRRRYGADYERFCANVPRWLPRLRAWRAADPDAANR